MKKLALGIIEIIVLYCIYVGLFALGHLISYLFNDHSIYFWTISNLALGMLSIIIPIAIYFVIIGVIVDIKKLLVIIKTNIKHDFK